MKKIIIIFSFLVIAFQGKSQFQMESDSKWFVGGNFGLSFGTVTYIDISPDIYYALTPKLHVGGGLSYTYYANYSYTPKFSTSKYGAKVAARYFLFDQIFVHSEYEGIHYTDPSLYNPTAGFFTQTRLLVGAGYRQYFGPNAYSTVSLLWDPDGGPFFFGINPLFKIGFCFGL